MGFYSNVLYQNDLKEIADHIVNPERLKGKRILITGANGLIASYIVDTLLWLNDNHDYNTDVYALVRTKEKAERRFFENLNNEHFRIVLQDVTQPLLNVDCPFDYVVHAACNAHPLAYATTPVEVIKSNITGTENVLNYMLTHGGGKMVFVSSSEVYGENKAADSLTESMYGYIDITNPRSCYSESKRAAESLCVSFSKEYNIDVCMVRPGFIFGPAVPSDNSRADAQFLRNAIAHKDIVMKSAGAQLRSYEYVSDAVSGILTAMINGENCNAYNIASPISSATIREFAETIAKSAGIKVVFENPEEVEKAGYSVISKCILNSDKLLGLGWKPSATLEEGVRRMIGIATEMADKL